MYEIAVIHLCTIGIPFYNLLILQHIISSKKKGKSNPQVIPDHCVHKDCYPEFKNFVYQIGYEKEPNKGDVDHQNQHYSEDIFKSHESISTVAEQPKYEKHKCNGLNFETMLNLFFLVSCSVFAYGVTLSIQSRHNLKADYISEIIVIIIINQCFIVILYNFIYLNVVEYLHNNQMKRFKANRQVSRFFLFSYNIFMLFVLIPPQIKISNTEIITEFLIIILTIILFLITYLKSE